MNFVDRHWKTLKKAYRLYMHGLNRAEIERLIKRDTPDIYSFYTKDIQPLCKEDFKKPRNILRFAREIFISFLLKLSRARRILYLIGLSIFVWGLIAAALYHIVLGFIILNALLALELADKLRTKDELEFAREIQLSLLPDIPPKIENLRVTAFTETAMEVGGDYYDCFRLNDRKVLFVVGDVSGKGITAALYMVRLQGYVAMLVKENQSPREMLIHLNRLCKSQLKRHFFVTAALAMYDPIKKQMVICRAGHNPILYFQQNKRRCFKLEPKGLALGLENNGLFEESLEEVNISLHSGDILFMYTDGLNETRNKRLEEFWEKRIEMVICKYQHESPEKLQSIILNEISEFRANQPVHDDLTFIIIKAEGIS